MRLLGLFGGAVLALSLTALPAAAQENGDPNPAPEMTATTQTSDGAPMAEDADTDSTSDALPQSGEGTFENSDGEADTQDETANVPAVSYHENYKATGQMHFEPARVLLSSVYGTGRSVLKGTITLPEDLEPSTGDRTFRLSIPCAARGYREVTLDVYFEDGVGTFEKTVEFNGPGSCTAVLKVYTTVWTPVVASADVVASYWALEASFVESSVKNVCPEDTAVAVITGQARGNEPMELYARLLQVTAGSEEPPPLMLFPGHVNPDGTFNLMIKWLREGSYDVELYLVSKVGNVKASQTLPLTVTIVGCKTGGEQSVTPTVPDSPSAQVGPSDQASATATRLARTGVSSSGTLVLGIAALAGGLLLMRRGGTRERR